MAFLLVFFGTVLFRHFFAFGYGVFLAFLFRNVLTFLHIDVFARFLGDLFTLLSIIVGRLTFFFVSGFTLLFFLVRAFVFVRGLATLLLLLSADFLVDIFTFLSVLSLTLLLLFRLAFLGVVVTAFAFVSTKKVEEQGSGTRIGSGLG